MLFTVFTNNTYIVAIKTTGNVYAYEVGPCCGAVRQHGTRPLGMCFGDFLLAWMCWGKLGIAVMT